MPTFLSACPVLGRRHLPGCRYVGLASWRSTCSTAFASSVLARALLRTNATTTNRQAARIRRLLYLITHSLPRCLAAGAFYTTRHSAAYGLGRDRRFFCGIATTTGHFSHPATTYRHCRGLYPQFYLTCRVGGFCFSCWTGLVFRLTPSPAAGKTPFYSDGTPQSAAFLTWHFRTYVPFVGGSRPFL